MQPDSAIPDPAYQDALRWLYGLSPNVRTAAEIRADHPRKLARMRALLECLDHPEGAFRRVLVAGTKGKGSIAAMTDAILSASGLRTGLVTSPHLVSWCERTRIAGEAITPSEVARLMPRVRAAAERLEADRPDLGAATTFEAGLALSLCAFAEREIELAVVEVGVGGGNDATNVLDPLAVAIGPISWDHQGTLGDTLMAIATQKAAIMRPGRLAVSAEQPAEAWGVVEQTAAEREARLELVGREWRWHPEGDSTCCGAFTVEGPRGAFAGLTTPLLGRHQRENATAAVALATDVLAGPHPPAGEGRPPDAAVRAGLASVVWPGRLQVLRERPGLVIDGAHNGDSAARLAEAVGECFEAKRVHLVLGTSVGKDVQGMLDALLPLAAKVTLTRSHHERSVPLPTLADTLAARGTETLIVPEVRAAVQRALDHASPDDLVLVTGSLFVVGEALEAFGPTEGRS